MSFAQDRVTEARRAIADLQLALGPTERHSLGGSEERTVAGPEEGTVADPEEHLLGGPEERTVAGSDEYAQLSYFDEGQGPATEGENQSPQDLGPDDGGGDPEPVSDSVAKVRVRRATAVAARAIVWPLALSGLAFAAGWQFNESNQHSGDAATAAHGGSRNGVRDSRDRSYCFVQIPGTETPGEDAALTQQGDAADPETFAIGLPSLPLEPAAELNLVGKVTVARKDPRQKRMVVRHGSAQERNRGSLRGDTGGRSKTVLLPDESMQPTEAELPTAHVDSASFDVPIMD